MGFPDEENTRMQPYLIEHNRPMLLKDFLRDRDGKSVAKKPGHIVLLRSWSKRAAATKMSAVHRVVKLLQFASSRSPSSVLPRSISRKLTKGGSNDIFGDAPETTTKVKVKDILRWRSFRDLADDDPAQLEYSPPSPDRSAATTSSSCSKCSSWCDSDFTAEEELPPWGGENDQEFWGKNKNNAAEEDEQQSPVSVLASPFRQVEEFISPHRQTLAFNEFAGTKRSATRRCDQERNFDKEMEICSATEEKARQLLRHLKRNADVDAEFDENVMLDFFIHEASASMNGKLNDDEFDGKTLRAAKSWMDGELGESYEWDVEEKREAFVKDMEKGFCWNKFEQEQQDLTHQLELWLFNYLIDDLVADFIIN